MGRLNNILMEAGGIGRNEDGSITRLGFSEDYFQALELIKKHMESLGIKTEVDPVGNLHGILPGKDPSLKSIVLGSHLDTVIKGGVFDGMLGVAGAVECVYRLKEQDIILDHTLEIWGLQHGRVKYPGWYLWQPRYYRDVGSGSAWLCRKARHF